MMMERKVEKELTTVIIEKRGNGLIGFGMDRKSGKELTKME